MQARGGNHARGICLTLDKGFAKERHQNLTISMGLGVLDYLQSGSVDDYDLDGT